MKNILFLPICALVFLFSGCPEDGAGGSDPGEPCRLASDCPEGSFCNEDGFCETGFAAGTCSEDADCPGEEICVKPEGVELGNCVYPHDCDEDEDCGDPDKICVDADEDGYRDCVYDGCTDDAQCVEDLDNCPISEEPRCVAGACVCLDYCGAACGEGLVCCAPPGDNAQCVPDPGPCASQGCDRGFRGEAAGEVGPYAPLECTYQDTECTCVENDPLPLDNFGAPHQLLVDVDGNKHLLAYNLTYGDLMFAKNAPNDNADYEFLSGIPEATDDNVSGSLGGPRGGVSEPGPDVGNYVDAIMDENDQIHAVWRNAETEKLEYATYKDGESWNVQSLDSTDDCGYEAQITSDDAGNLIIGHTCIIDAAGTSTLKLLVFEAQSGPSSPATYMPFWRYVPDESEFIGLEDRLALTDVTATVGPNGLVMAGYHTGNSELMLIRQTGGDLSGDATFETVVVLEQDAESDPGHVPAIAVRNDGTVLIVSSDYGRRELVISAINAAGTVQAPVVLDDGSRLQADGSTADHPLNAPAVVLTANGDAFVAYTDGTNGNFYMTKYQNDGTTDDEPTLLLDATDASGNYNGHYGFHVEGQPNGSKILFSVAKLNAQADRFADIIVVEVTP